MKNKEKYREEILNYEKVYGFCEDFIEPNILKPLGLECNGTPCERCNLICQMWLEEEYKEPEPEVDWSKVPVDTPILVRDSENHRWRKRYFAKYKNGKVFAWGGGETSWSNTDGYTTPWEYAKLADVKEEEKWLYF